jgi:Na+:H+ antiporter, NhaA family
MPDDSRRFRPSTLIDAARHFIHVETSSGLILLFAAVVALVWANSPWGDSYEDLWHTTLNLDLDAVVFSDSLRHWINDGLMALFFFLVGLEIKRELVHGELSSPRRAALPAIAALGGMAAPAAIYLAFNLGGDGTSGWGIPMATDIAFALGVLSLLSNRVPFSLKVFLLALAIADDIGAILVIAIFYTSEVNFEALAAAAIILGAIMAMSRNGIRNVDIYIVFGVLFWAAVYKSGIHATLAGVALGVMTPARSAYSTEDFPAAAESLLNDYRSADEDDKQGVLSHVEDLAHGTEAPVDRLERKLHPWVSFGVVPLFALANAGVTISTDTVSDAASSPVALGVALGLLLGKPLGITLATFIAVRLRLCDLPTGATWPQLAAVGVLAGIGFTVSLLITSLAFTDSASIADAKLGVLAASLAAGTVGYFLLKCLNRSEEGRNLK